MDMVPLNNGVNMPMLGLGTYALREGKPRHLRFSAARRGHAANTRFGRGKDPVWLVLSERKT